jgi:hypothetical protein
MDAASVDRVKAKSIEILSEHSNGMSYRDLLSQVSQSFPEIERAELSLALGELPKSHADVVWRPKPGHFKIRTDGEGPAVYARGRKKRSAGQADAKRPAWPERPLPNRVENLVKLGFEEVGEWSQTGDGIECLISVEADLRHALIAYAMAGSVVFIGRPLRNVPVRQGYVGRSIRSALARERPVKVFALRTWEPCRHFGIDVNVGAGIEDELIERMQPPWNNYPA